jgi:hypothetical protein
MVLIEYFIDDYIFWRNIIMGLRRMCKHKQFLYMEYILLLCFSDCIVRGTNLATSM